MVKAYVEIPIFLFYFAFLFLSNVGIDFTIYRSCYVLLDYNRTDCELLGTGSAHEGVQEMEEQAQAAATGVMVIMAVMMGLIPPILCFFAGSWTNTYGRRPLILSSTLGFTLYMVFLLVVVAIPYASPWYYLISLIPLCLSGGIPGMLTGLYTTVLDITPEKDRGPRMGIIEFLTMIASTLAQSTSAYALNAWGYLAVYLICTGCLILSLLYSIFFIPETIKNPEKKERLKNLFKLSMAKETLKSTFVKRKGNGRVLVILALLTGFLYQFTNKGSWTILLLYVRKTFNWSLEKFNIYIVIMELIGAIGSIIGALFLHKFLNIREPYILIIGFVLALAAILFQGLTSIEWHLYITGSMRLISNAIPPMNHALISKLVPQDELSNIFSMAMALDMFGSFLGVGVFTYFYNVTLLVRAEAFHFLAAGLYTLALLFVGIFLYLEKFNNPSNKMILSSSNVGNGLESQKVSEDGGVYIKNRT